MIIFYSYSHLPQPVSSRFVSNECYQAAFVRLRHGFSLFQFCDPIFRQNGRLFCNSQEPHFGFDAKIIPEDLSSPVKSASDGCGWTLPITGVCLFIYELQCLRYAGHRFGFCQQWKSIGERFNQRDEKITISRCMRAKCPVNACQKCSIRTGISAGFFP